MLASSLLGVVVVDHVQRGLALLQLQALDLRLQLIQLLLEVLALLHVLHPSTGGEGGWANSDRGDRGGALLKKLRTAALRQSNQGSSTLNGVRVFCFVFSSKGWGAATLEVC